MEIIKQRKLIPIFGVLLALVIMAVLGSPRSLFQKFFDKNFNRIHPAETYNVKYGEKLDLKIAKQVNYFELINPESLNSFADEIKEIRLLKKLNPTNLTVEFKDPANNFNQIRFITTATKSKDLYGYIASTGTIYCYYSMVNEEINLSNFSTKAKVRIALKNSILKNLDELSLINLIHNLKLEIPFKVKIAKSEVQINSLDTKSNSIITSAIVAFGIKKKNKIKFTKSILVNLDVAQEQSIYPNNKENSTPSNQVFNAPNLSKDSNQLPEASTTPIVDIYEATPKIAKLDSETSLERSTKNVLKGVPSIDSSILQQAQSSAGEVATDLPQICCVLDSIGPCPVNYSGILKFKKYKFYKDEISCTQDGGELEVLQSSAESACESDYIEYNECILEEEVEETTEEDFLCVEAGKKLLECDPGFTGRKIIHEREWVKKADYQGGRIKADLDVNECLDVLENTCEESPEAEPVSNSQNEAEKHCCHEKLKPRPCPEGYTGERTIHMRTWQSAKCRGDIVPNSREECKDTTEGLCVKIPVTPPVPPSPSSSASPSVSPSASPSVKPSVSPSVRPSTTPSVSPSLKPSVSPSASPSVKPSITPSTTPSASPSVKPSVSPSPSPKVSPSVTPSPSPSPDRCCICQYGYKCDGKTDERINGFDKECEFILDGADKKLGCKQKHVIGQEPEELSNALCQCKETPDLKVFYVRNAHATENNCNRPTDDAKFIFDYAQCSDLFLVDLGCMVFSDAQKAYRYSQKLKNYLTKCCKNTSIQIAASQRTNNISTGKLCADPIQYTVCTKENGTSTFDVQYPKCTTPGEGQCMAGSTTPPCILNGEYYTQKCVPKDGCTSGIDDCREDVNTRKCCLNGQYEAPVKMKQCPAGASRPSAG